MKKTLLALLTIAFVAGCGSERFAGDCNEQMDDLTDERGAPERIDRLDVDRYHQHTWWYGRNGFSRTFTWDGSTGSCTTVDESFEPVGQGVSRDDRRAGG